MKQKNCRTISVVIVTYNSETDIKDAIMSIPRLSGLQVIAVDNASTDDSVEILQSLQTDGLLDHLILSDKNLGFSKAVNLAMESIVGDDVLLFNPDARMDSDCLERLRELASIRPETGVLSPVVYSSSGVRTMTAGRQPKLWPMFTHFSGLSRLFPNIRFLEGRQLFLDHHTSEDRDVEWVAGCCMYIKHEAIEKVGLLTERWFMYGEDVEYCKRVLDAQLKIVSVHDARCFHEMGASVVKASSEINTMWPRNLFDYYKNEYKPNALNRTLWRLVFTIGMLSRSAIHQALAKKSGDTARQAQAVRFRAFAKSLWVQVN